MASAIAAAAITAVATTAAAITAAAKRRNGGCERIAVPKFFYLLYKNQLFTVVIKL